MAVSSKTLGARVEVGSSGSVTVRLKVQLFITMSPFRGAPWNLDVEFGAEASVGQA